jgi:hypothetical protein
MSLTGLRHFCAFTIFAATLLAPFAVAQVTTTGIRGIVRDPSGSVIPNVTVKAKDSSTEIEKTTVSSAQGEFIFPNLQSGSYDVTASAAGFQTALYAKVVVDTGRITDLTVEMKIGTATQTLEVSATATQLETSTNEVGKTIDNKSIMNVPLAGRDTLNFALLMPGVGNTQNNDRYSTFNGLPNASMDITVDGMYNGSQRWKSGGTSFYEFGPSRLDAMEQVTVSTTGLGADAGGEGAMQIRMTTKRGTDQYHFKVMEQLSNEDMNANSYFNTLQHIPRPRSRQNNEVGLFSGPLAPFIPYLKHKLFFFAYFEAQPQPGSVTNTTTLLTPASQQGNFTYLGTDGQQHTVNLLAAAGAAGFTSTIDPTIAGVLSKINATTSHAIGYLPVAGQPYEQSMLWNFNTFTNQQYPAARIDYQITPNIGWHGSWNLRHSAFGSTTGPPYPGTGYDWNGASTITTYVASNQVDWTITPHLINNFTFGVQSNLEAFNPGGSVFQWAPQDNKILSLPLISAYIPNNVPENRNNPVFDFIDNLTWMKNRHTFTMGGSVRHTTYYDRYWYASEPLSYSFGVATGDPVATVLQSALPFINTSNNDVANANSLYALLTGRLTSISGTQAVDQTTHKYTPYSPLFERYLFNTAGLYFQDSFRVNGNLTVNYGLRWQFDGPISTTNGIDAYPTASSFYGPSTGNFQPGVLNGNQTPVFGPVKNPYRSDLVNPAPNFGFAWNPSGGSGLLGKLLGERKTVVRGSYSVNFYNEGMNAITFLLEGNQGATQSITGTAGNPGFPLGGVNLSSPIPTISTNPASFTFPMPESIFALNGGNSLNYVNPDLRSPYVQNWTLGVQRQLPGHTLLEVRYVGNKSTHMWHEQNMEETNIFENGFLTQFQAAQNNLAIANGLTVAQLTASPSPTLKVKSFADTGLPGQVATPIFDTAFGANGSNPALAAGSGYGNSTFITNLEQGAAGTLATSLASTKTPTYYCRLVGANFGPCAAQGYSLATQYPINFFQSNPYASTMNYQDSNGNTNYNSLQVQARKSLSHGVLVDVAYTWSHALGDIQNATSTTALSQFYTTRNGRLNYGPIPFDHRHTLTAFWTYDVPLGKGKALNINNSFIDRIVGGWTLGGVEKIISGAPTLLGGGRATVNNLSTAGVTFGNGLTLSQLRDRLTTTEGNYDSTCNCFRTNVSDIIQTNGAVNTAYYGPGSTAGQFSDILYLYGKTTFQLDLNLNKDFRIKERLKAGINFQVFNFLNHPFLGIGSTSPTATTFGQITGTSGPSGGARYAQIRGYISW